MTRTHLLMALAILTPVVTAIEGDVATFRKAKKKDPSAKFDTWIFAVKAGKALTVGVAAAAGVSAVTE